MAAYKIGNILRGYVQFKARSDHKAWEIGCEKFNELVPTDSTIGRQVELYVGRPVATTPGYKKYLVRDGARPGGKSPVASGWYPVVVGYSKEPFPKEEFKA
ncbi:MAG: hypothetical protein PHR90_09865 [Sphaerochaetaceae bacterium]|nr:hypothetical protein [Sphaerochaetaceae bacterium]